MLKEAEVVDVAIVIVAYNSAETIARCVDSVLRFAPRHFSSRVYVVDNASSDTTRDILDGMGDRVTVIHSDTNVGFGVGNNLVINRYPARYHYLHNADAYLQDNVLDTVVAYLDQKPEVGIIGLPLVYPDLSPQTSAYAFSKPSKWALQLLGVDRAVRWIVRNPRLSPVTELLARTNLGATYVATHREDAVPGPAGPRRVDWVCGAALILRDATRAQLGGFDPHIFLYTEDQDLCLRAWQSGWTVEQAAVRPVIHDFGWGKHRATSKKVADLKYASQVYYIDKHFGGQRMRWSAMRVLLWLQRRSWA